MDLIQLLVVVLVLCVVFWLLANYVAPRLPAPWGNVVLAVFAIVVCLWLLAAVGVLPDLRAVRVG
jgi:hypothetical protein